MLVRCYNAKFHERQPQYKGCTVCEEWLNYSNFKFSTFLIFVNMILWFRSGRRLFFVVVFAVLFSIRNAQIQAEPASTAIIIFTPTAKREKNTQYLTRIFSVLLETFAKILIKPLRTIISKHMNNLAQRFHKHWSESS